jgi:hypothetical protein
VRTHSIIAGLLTVSVASTGMAMSTMAGAATASYEAESSSNTLAGRAAVGNCNGRSGGRKVRFVGNNSGALQFNGRRHTEPTMLNAARSEAMWSSAEA